MNHTLTADDTTLGYEASLTTSERVIGAVADAADSSPLDLDPLARSIDPDALDALVEQFPGEDASVEFPYSGFDVRVFGDGTVVVDE